MKRRLGPLLAGIGLALVVVLALAAMWVAAQKTNTGDHLRSPLDARPGGTLAVAEVLRQQGVDVEVVHSYREAELALSGGAGDATLVIDDDWWVLTEEAYDMVGTLSDRIVLIQPSDLALEALAPETSYGGFAGGVAEAACELPAAERAERIDTAGEGISAPASAIRCFPTADGSYALVHLDTGSTSLSLLGASELLSNEHITEHGNAALALGLLGERDRLVWYQPDINDYAFESSGSLARFQAEWYLPLVVLIFVVGLAAIVWKGRRMGPVVVENLPVEVRSSETMEGRARLYERTGARDHTIRTLRIATLARLARTLGLPRTASEDEIIVAAASATGRDPRAIIALVRTTTAGDDRMLVQLSDELLALERDVARGVMPR